jgi:hypothetical protein
VQGGQDKNNINMKTDTVNNQTGRSTNWVTYPTKKNLVVTISIWFVSNFLLLLATTNVFTEPFMNKNYTILYIMMAVSTWTAIKMTVNFLKTRTKTGSAD